MNPRIVGIKIKFWKNLKRYFFYTFLLSFLVMVFKMQKDIPKIAEEKKNSTLIITIKTTFKNHLTRIPQIIDTWYQLSPKNIYFVTDAFDPMLNQSINGHLITTTCSSNHDPLVFESKRFIKDISILRDSLGCKLNEELRIMVKQNATWSCHVDDDNYVNIPALKDLLENFDSNLPFYLGRTATNKPVTQNGRTFWFAIGGAGICFSNGAIKKMAPTIESNALHFEYSMRDNKPDDWALGYMMDLLGIKLTEIVYFMSQYDKLDSIPLNAIKDTPILSFREIDNTFINLPYFFYPNDDPYKFQTLHCFIFPKLCNKNLDRLGIDVFVPSKSSSYGTYVLPTVKAIINN